MLCICLIPLDVYITSTHVNYNFQKVIYLRLHIMLECLEFQNNLYKIYSYVIRISQSFSFLDNYLAILFMSFFMIPFSYFYGEERADIYDIDYIPTT